jgi:hypothetical protein
MLYLSTKLTNLPLLSIRSSGRIGTVIEPIINPHNLHIDGFYCQAIHSSNKLILLDIHVRDLSPAGIIIDDHQDLSESEDLVRLKPILELNFKIIDKPVVSSKKKIGKLVEYAIDKESMFVQKLYVQPPVWQNINQSRLTFDRSSVIEVSDTQIVVSGPEETDKAKRTVKVPGITANYSSANSSLTNE